MKLRCDVFNAELCVGAICGKCPRYFIREFSEALTSGVICRPVNCRLIVKTIQSVSSVGVCSPHGSCEDNWSLFTNSIRLYAFYKNRFGMKFSVDIRATTE
jgi:hypothetical protein